MLLKKHLPRNLAKRLLQEAFYLSVLFGLRFAFSVLHFIIIYFRFVIRFYLFIIRFCRFNVRSCGYVNRNCRFVIINLLFVNRVNRLNNGNCRFAIRFSLFVNMFLPFFIIKLLLFIRIILWLIIKNRKNKTKGRQPFCFISFLFCFFEL